MVEETSNNDDDDDDDDGIEAGDLPFLPCLFVHLLFLFFRRQEDIFFLLLPFISLFVIVIVSRFGLGSPPDLHYSLVSVCSMGAFLSCFAKLTDRFSLYCLYFRRG